MVIPIFLMNFFPITPRIISEESFIRKYKSIQAGFKLVYFWSSSGNRVPRQKRIRMEMVEVASIFWTERHSVRRRISVIRSSNIHTDPPPHSMQCLFVYGGQDHFTFDWHR